MGRFEEMRDNAERKREREAAGVWERGRKATCNLEFTANVPECWDLSEPSLPLILLWILKYPHLTISPFPPPFLVLPPPPPILPLPIRAMYLFYFWLYMMLYSLSLSSFFPVSSLLCEWDSCPTMKLRKRRLPSGIWLSERKGDRGRDAVCCVSLNFSS